MVRRVRTGVPAVTVDWGSTVCKRTPGSGAGAIGFKSVRVALIGMSGSATRSALAREKPSLAARRRSSVSSSDSRADCRPGRDSRRFWSHSSPWDEASPRRSRSSAAAKAASRTASSSDAAVPRSPPEARLVTPGRISSSPLLRSTRDWRAITRPRIFQALSSAALTGVSSASKLAMYCCRSSRRASAMEMRSCACC